MKKSIFILAVTTLLSGNVLTSCKSNAEKENDALENVQDANQSLEDAQTETVTDAANTKANEAEWQAFKAEVNADIAKNEARIAGLKSDLKKQGKAMDASYEKRVDELEAKNEALKTKLKEYEVTQTDWNEFKREFNSDMSDLGDAFKNLTVNNKN
jgi:chromosome segregation ATPase